MGCGESVPKTVKDAVAYPVDGLATAKVGEWCPQAVLLTPKTKMTPATG